MLKSLKWESNVEQNVEMMSVYKKKVTTIDFFKAFIQTAFIYSSIAIIEHNACFESRHFVVKSSGTQSKSNS